MCPPSRGTTMCWSCGRDCPEAVESRGFDWLEERVGEVLQKAQA